MNARAALLAFAAALLVAVAACAKQSPIVGGADTCPSSEPPGGARCVFAVGRACTYTIAAVHDGFCRCYEGKWVCDTTLGLDSPEDAPGCPPSAPVVGSVCPLTAKDPPGMRAGCHYQLPATPIVHDCSCAYPAGAPDRAAWTCGRRTGADSPTDARGCPWVEPKADSLCIVAAEAQCQYGYNLSTTCRCAPVAEPRGARAWKCETHAEPPSPGR